MNIGEKFSRWREKYGSLDLYDAFAAGHVEGAQLRQDECEQLRAERDALKSEVKENVDIVLSHLATPLSAFGGKSALECLGEKTYSPAQARGVLQRIWDCFPGEIDQAREECERMEAERDILLQGVGSDWLALRADLNIQIARLKADGLQCQADYKLCREECDRLKAERDMPADHYKALAASRENRVILLQSQLAESQAQAAAMREALEYYADPFAIMDSINGTYEIKETWYQKARNTLAAPGAGKEYAERVRLLEVVAEAAMYLRNSGFDGPFIGIPVKPLFDALAALERAGEK